MSEEKRPSGSIKIPEGIWIKCKKCKEIIYYKEVQRLGKICPKCNYHFYISAKERFEMLFDDGKYELFDNLLISLDPLKFKDRKKYKDRLKEAEEKAKTNEAVLNAEGKIDGIDVILCAMEYEFIGGSMGSVVGEKITRAAEKALKEREPLIIISASGGARMQEGIFSLMQLAKISSAIAKLKEAKIPYISVLTDPTTGGVTASYAMQGDINIAEPGALIGFAGPRVIEQTIKQKLPEGFQTAEFLQEHGMVDIVVPRNKLKETISNILRILWTP